MAVPLHYRPWQGTLRRPWGVVWPVARVALAGLWRRRLFWVLYGFGLLLFLMFFFGTYLLDWAESQIPAAPIQVGRFQTQPEQAMKFVRAGLQALNGSQETFAYFFAYQGTMVMIVLALAGSVLVGNDYTFRSLPFYLAKPIGRWHYLAGKGLAIAVVVNLLTTLPALIMFAQHGLDDWAYLTDPHFFGSRGPSSWALLAGVLAYSLLLTVFLTILVLAVASWVRRTLPLVMVWTSLFLFGRLVANIFVDGLQYSANWRLVDLWNNLSILGRGCLGYSETKLGLPGPQPTFLAAGLTLAAVTLVCLVYLNQRTRSVEVLT